MDVIFFANMITSRFYDYASNIKRIGSFSLGRVLSTNSSSYFKNDLLVMQPFSSATKILFDGESFFRIASTHFLLENTNREQRYSQQHLCSTKQLYSSLSLLR